MRVFLSVFSARSVEDEADIDAVIIAQDEGQAAILAGGEFAGEAKAGGWLVFYSRDRFRPPTPEEQETYVTDEDMLIFRKGPITVLLDPTDPEQANGWYARIIELPFIEISSVPAIPAKANEE